MQEQQGGSPSADLLIGLRTDKRIARSGSIFLTDALGSTVALASSGSVQTSYGYDAYGVPQVTGTASDNPFQYTGRENDGTGLLNYRNRYYNPTWGRFISEDRIGLRGGINLYRYANNDPVSLSDPSGNCPVCIGVALGAGVAFGKALGDTIMCLAYNQCGGSGSQSGSSATPTPSGVKPTSGDPCANDAALCSKQGNQGDEKNDAGDNTAQNNKAADAEKDAGLNQNSPAGDEYHDRIQAASADGKSL